MAIKTSNSITFTEQKKIVEIKEWYLAVNTDSIHIGSVAPVNANEGDLWFNKNNPNNSKLLMYSNSHWRAYESQFTENVSDAIVSPDIRYLWNYEEIIYSIGASDIADPVLVGMYGTGDNGKGIVEIIGYYKVLPTNVLPQGEDINEWVTNINDAGSLSSGNKYLWKYEKIFYTDGETTSTTPCIIGVYGDSGEDAVLFYIYSPTGFEFNNDVDTSEAITEIDLLVGAFRGSNAINDATFAWFYLDADDQYVSLSSDMYESVSISGKPGIKVNLDTPRNLKCVMTYDGKTYESYATLTLRTNSYYATIDFINNDNILDQTEEYLIGYVSLYKNQNIEETISTSDYYIGDNSVNGNIITTNYSADTITTPQYFLYEASDGSMQAVLGEYINGEGWRVVNENLMYIYQTNINDNNTNIFVLRKNDIKKQREIKVNILDSANESESFVAIASAIVSDLNDAYVGDTPPDTSVYGTFWMDTTTNTLKMYILNDNNEGEWAPVSKKHPGQSIFTEKPITYSTGDMWIVSQEDADGKFTEGSMWTATDSSNGYFNEEHWSDAIPKMTQLQENVECYFDFQTSTGLKIGQKDAKFYVNISPTRMSFCENKNITSNSVSQTDIDPNEVVYIANNSASITNLVVKDKANVDCELFVKKKVNISSGNNETSGFSWQIEDDGSFSLVKF